MDTLRGLVVVFLMALAGLVLLKVGDFMTAMYVNQLRPLAEGAAENVSAAGGGLVTQVNASDYDLYERVKPYFQALDVAMALAVVVAFMAVFIYTRERR